MKQTWAKCETCGREFDLAAGNYDPDQGPAVSCKKPICPFRVGPPRSPDEVITRRIKTPPHPMKKVDPDDDT